MIHFYIFLAWWFWVGAWFAGRFSRHEQDKNFGDPFTFCLGLVLSSIFWPFVVYLLIRDHRTEVAERTGPGAMQCLEQ